MLSMAKEATKERGDGRPRTIRYMKVENLQIFCPKFLSLFRWEDSNSLPILWKKNALPS